MKLTKLPEEFIKAQPVIEQIEAAGFEAYFVGGSVRDIILDQPIHDVDIATSAFPEEVKQIFPRTIDVGIEHGTVLILVDDEQYEVTTFRTESTYQDYRRPDEVTFVRSLEEDLKRRDFTMNALAMGHSGEIIDLFDGITAIKEQQIVAVGNASERFHEDALRMMRGLRFSSQLGFDLEESTAAAIKEHHHLLEKISVERIYVELIKLLTSKHRNKGLAMFIETNCFAYCPGLKNKEQLLKTVLEISDEKLLKTEEVAWLTLGYLLEITDMKSFLREWKTSNKLINHVDTCLSALRKRDKHEWELLDLYQCGAEVIKDVEYVRSILDKPNNVESALRDYEALPIKTIKDLQLSGKELLRESNKQPGPWVGETLAYLETKVILGELDNQQGVLLKAANLK